MRWSTIISRRILLPASACRAPVHFTSYYTNCTCNCNKPLAGDPGQEPRTKPMAVATNCYGARRLSDLLQEQQEPFLLQAPQRRRSPVQACGRRLRELCAATKGRCVHATHGGGGYKTATKALVRWSDLAGCFRCGARQRFHRLPRAGGRRDVVSEAGLDGGDEDCGRQLSPVSVLDLHSDDEESPVLSHWDDDSDGVRPSTSASSPPSDLDLPGASATPCSTFFVTTTGKIRGAMEVDLEGDSKRLQRRKSAEASSLERATVSDWERIAADISRIPTLVALDLSASAREWRRHVAGEEEEARRVGQSIEAMILEEVRWEAVRDMIRLREF